MATGNGKGSVLPELLAEVHDLRTELQTHTETTAARFEKIAELLTDSVRETRERFGRMDQHLGRMVRLISAVTGTIEDHETRLRHLEGR